VTLRKPPANPFLSTFARGAAHVKDSCPTDPTPVTSSALDVESISLKKRW